MTSIMELKKNCSWVVLVLKVHCIYSSIQKSFILHCNDLVFWIHLLAMTPWRFGTKWKVSIHLQKDVSVWREPAPALPGVVEENRSSDRVRWDLFLGDMLVTLAAGFLRFTIPFDLPPLKLVLPDKSRGELGDTHPFVNIDSLPFPLSFPESSVSFLFPIEWRTGQWPNRNWDGGLQKMGHVFSDWSCWWGISHKCPQRKHCLTLYRKQRILTKSPVKWGSYNDSKWFYIGSIAKWTEFAENFQRQLVNPWFVWMNCMRILSSVTANEEDLN